jgi:hypothetical protein
MTGDALIHYYCVCAAHGERSRELADRLTIHLGAWAYCPLNARLDGHDWRETGGLALGPLEIRGQAAVLRDLAASDAPGAAQAGSSTRPAIPVSSR